VKICENNCTICLNSDQTPDIFSQMLLIILEWLMHEVTYAQDLGSYDSFSFRLSSEIVFVLCFD